MEKIYNNLSIENLAKTDWINQFDEKQKEEIILGLEDNLNVSIYAKKEFEWVKMEIIREGLEEGLDVSIYAKPELSWKQMLKIKLELLKERKNKENEQNIQ